MTKDSRKKSAAGEVFEAIASAMTRPPGAAALAHFPSLRAQTARTNSDFGAAIESVDRVVQAFRTKLEDDALVKDAFRNPADAAPFRKIVPVLLESVQRTARKLLAATRPAGRATSLDELGRINVRNDDFIDLGTVVRQFIDSMIETAYQTTKLDPRAFNYKFLESLVSFAPVAPLSLNSRLYSDDLQRIIQGFAEPSGRKRRVESYATNEHSKFAERVEFLADRLGADKGLQKQINLVFKFCSELVHLGYASDAALGTARGNQFVLGTAEDLYTASAEKLAEVKLRLLRQCVKYYVAIFVAACRDGMNSMLVDSQSGDDALHATGVALLASHGLNDRIAFEFVRDGEIGSDRPIVIECGRCGDEFSWEPPHHQWSCYCRGCGALYEIKEVPEAVDYIISVEGASRVLGSDAPDVPSLPAHLREKLRRLTQRHFPPRESEEMRFRGITDLEHVNEETLKVDTKCTARPAMDAQFQLVGYVAHKALTRQAEIQLICGCGAPVRYLTSKSDLLCKCEKCDRVIGIFGVSGDGTHLAISGSPSGHPQPAPIHGQRSLKLR